MSAVYQDFNSLVQRKQQDFIKPVVFPFSVPFRFLRGLTATVIRGVDLSHWNGNVDFDALYSCGIRFVYLKVSESTNYADSMFSTYWPKALDAGLLVGGYHFMRANASGADQADWYLTHIKPLLNATGGKVLPAMLDSETRDGMANSAIINCAGQWFSGVKSEMRKPGMYTSPYLWGNMYSPAPSWAGNYWGWVAHWTSTGSPTWPAQWNPDLRKFWQYGIYPRHSWVGAVSGVPSEVDCNWFFGSINDLRHIMGYDDEPSPPPPSDDLEKRVIALEASVSKIKDTIEVLFARDDALGANILSIHDQLNYMDSDLADTKKRLEQVRGAVDAHTIKIASLDKDMTNEIARNDEQNRIIESLGSTIEAFNAFVHNQREFWLKN
jgi:GH25 family lysozyme M1 (1,4-beta-N-acetylmuramidase)